MATRTGSNSSGTRFEFTRARVEAAACAPGKSQALYWDTKQPGLGLRVTAAGARSFIFEGKLGRQTIRMTIGPASMPIRAAKDQKGKPVTAGADTVAARYAAQMAEGIDPRAVKAQRIADQQTQRDAVKLERAKRELLALEAWAVYCEARRARWGERNYAEHLKYASAGGEARKRAKEVTKPGALYALLNRPLADLDAAAVEVWAEREAVVRAPTARLGFRMLRAFVNWCAEQPDYRELVRADCCATTKAREALGKPGAKSDALEREQLAGWFEQVRKLAPVSAAYLQTLLLTGARREEVATLRWEDVDFRWRKLAIRDKVQGSRTIPLTPYVASLLVALPRRNEWVFASVRPLRLDSQNVARRARRNAANGTDAPMGGDKVASASGRIAEPRYAHQAACERAGIEGLTLHGLRRSFGTLAEWVEVPAGVIAQIQGHAPSATAEKHYRVRPIDLLRLHHDRIEKWLLEEGRVPFDAEQAARDAAEAERTGGLRLVEGGKAAA